MENFVAIQSSKIMGTKAGKVAHWLRTLATLLEEPCLNPSAHIGGSQLSATSVPADTTLPTDLLGHFIHGVHRPTLRQNLHTHKTTKETLSEK